MRATLMLADHAQIADGKLFISGGGWTACQPGAAPCAVAVIFHVPWQETDKKVSFSLRLIDEDGNQVSQPGATDGMPVMVNGSFESRRPPGFTPGSEINVPTCFNIVLHLEPSKRYSWVLDADGQTDDAWRLSFETRASAQVTPGMRV
jgi:hypothetical protein